VPAARRNADRRRRRAARASERREQRRRREEERRRREREQRAAPRPPAASPSRPDPAPVAPPHAPRPPAARAEPPDLPGMEGLRSRQQPPPDPFETSRPAPTEPVHAAPAAAERAARAAVAAPPRGGRRRTTIRRIDPWSVFRLSLVLYFCLLVVVTLGMMLFWLVLSRLPLLQRTMDTVEQLGIPIDPGLILGVLLPVGVLNVLLWSGANLFFAVLYNLVADLVGGLGITLGDDER
jgi:hypothetical protein